MIIVLIRKSLALQAHQLSFQQGGQERFTICPRICWSNFKFTHQPLGQVIDAGGIIKVGPDGSTGLIQHDKFA